MITNTSGFNMAFIQNFHHLLSSLTTHYKSKVYNFKIIVETNFKKNI